MEPVVAAWLLKEIVAPDAYSRSVDQLRQQSWRKTVIRAVRERHGGPSRRYKKWLRQDSTFELLVQRTPEAFEELVTSLAAAESRLLFRRAEIDRETAEALVVETIRAFLPALDPSLATAVADHRAEHRHLEVLDRLDASRSFADRLERLPQTASELLRASAESHPIAERVVNAIVEGDPRATLRCWSIEMPSWMAPAPGTVFAALGMLAQAYGLRSEASRFFERAAELGHEVQRSLARAAFEAAAAAESNRAAALMDRAKQLDDDEFVNLIGAAIAEDPDAVLAVDFPDATEALVVVLRAYALRSTGRIDEAIQLLSGSLQSPPNASIALMLGEALLQRSVDRQTTSRMGDRRRAVDLAVEARDARRRWRGNSGEAVELACRAALMAGEYETVLRLGTTEPTGKALPQEAARPEVKFAVSQAATALGDRETLAEVASSTEGFHRALLEADLAAQAGASSPELAEQYKRAWELAGNEEAKVAVWIGASHAGVHPLPGQAELDAKGGDLPILCRGAQLLANGDLDEAKALLRPRRDSESACRLLVGVLVEAGDIDGAVRELSDMAQRFATIDPLIRAAELLAQRERINEAVEFSDKALLSTPVGSGSRGLLHEIGVAAANNRQAWHEMETRVRAWIDELGPSRRRSYLLALARFNQTDAKGAWRVLQELGEARPESAGEARLWITLAAQFAPAGGTLSTALELVEQHSGDRDVRAAGVNAFLLMGDDKCDIDPDELARWEQVIRDRADDDDPYDTFISITIPDDPEGQVEALRPYLEPQARRMEEWLKKVRNEGFPYGMLAVAAGRPYTAAVIHRAAGFIPLASPSDEVKVLELQDARNAMDGGQSLVDNSALATGWHVQDLWPLLVGAVGGLYTTDESRRDAALSATNYSDRQAGTLGWDVASARPVLHEDDEEVLVKLNEHASWVRGQTAGLPTRNTGLEGSTRMQRAREAGAWMVSFEVARSSSIALWADDVGLRTLARNEGVPAFGTDSLLRALCERGRVSQQRVSEAFNELWGYYYVDLPWDEASFLHSVRANNYRSGPAVLAVTRKPFWSDLQRALALWTSVIEEAGRCDPSAVAHWVYAGCVGVSGVVEPAQALQLSAGLLVKSAGAVQSDPTAFASCAEAATQAAADTSQPDPVELALRMTLELLTGSIGLQMAATEVAKIGRELAGDHRSALRRVLFEG